MRKLRNLGPLGLHFWTIIPLVVYHFFKFKLLTNYRGQGSLVDLVMVTLNGFQVSKIRGNGQKRKNLSLITRCWELLTAHFMTKLEFFMLI